MRQLDTAHCRRVELAGMAALECGSGGDPVLLVPGYTGSKEDFGPILAPLADAGLHLVAIDLPGQFESPGPQDPAGYTPRALAEPVRAAAARLGARVHLVGHSFGGLVARAAVLDEPDRFRSLVLMDSGPAAIDGNRRVVITQLEPLLPQTDMAGMYEAATAMYAAQAGYEAPPAALAAFYRRRFVAGSKAMLQGMGDAIRAEPDRVAELARVALPILVLFGAEDDSWPPAVQQDMARRLGAPVTVIPSAMHSPAVENPEATVAALLRFWSPGAGEAITGEP